MILFLDCETTGLPRNYQAPISDGENWPRAVQIAWTKTTNSGDVICKHNHIIFPEVFEIPAEATAKHGITTAYACEHGVLIKPVLETLFTDITECDYVVGHNIEFDKNIIGAEYWRAGMHECGDDLRRRPQICTMKSSTNFCNIPGPYGPKWPKLGELFSFLFPEDEIPKEHNAANDVETCLRCFFELVKRDVIFWPAKVLELTPAEAALISPPVEFVPLAQLVDELKYKRQELSEIISREKAIKDEIAERLAAIKAEKDAVDLACAELEKCIREGAVEAYKRDGQRKPTAGVEVKLFAECNILDAEVARAWCFSNLPGALVLDPKKVQKYATDFGAVPGVEVLKDIPCAQIATKL